MATPITLDINADYNSLPELAQELLERIERYEKEYTYNEGNPNWQLYLRGIIAGYESVLSAIGYNYPEEN